MKQFIPLLAFCFWLETCQMPSVEPVDFSKEILDSLIVEGSQIVDSAGLKSRHLRLFHRLNRMTGNYHGYVEDDSNQMVLQTLMIRKPVTLYSEDAEDTLQIKPCSKQQRLYDWKERANFFFPETGVFTFRDVVYLEEYPQGDFFAIVQSLTYNGELITLFYHQNSKKFYIDGSGGLLGYHAGTNKKYTTIRFVQTGSMKFILYLAAMNGFPISPVPDDMHYATAKLQIITSNRKFYQFDLADRLLALYAKDDDTSLDKLLEFGKVRDSILVKIMRGTRIYSNPEKQVVLSFPLKEDTAQFVLDKPRMTFNLKKRGSK